ncbi:MAG: tail fiber domain-containing protein, partial [Bdellovibrionales bacterium]
TGVTTTGSPVTITSNTATTSSTTGALRVTGGISTQAALWAGTSITSPSHFGGSSASGNITIDSTSNSTKGFVLLNPSGGSVGIGMSGGVTARLHLRAGATGASSAPLKFTTGSLLSTPESGAMEFDGSSFWLTVGSTRSRVSTTNASGDFTGVSSITGSGALTISSGGSNTDLTLSAVGTGRVTTAFPFVISNSTSTTSSTTGALRVAGGISSENSIWAATNVTSPIFYGGSGASGSVTIDSTSNVTKGFVVLAPSGGDVGIGTATPGFKLDVQGGDINASGSVRSAGIALTSDVRFKKNIDEIQDPLEKILGLRGVTYNWRVDEFPERHFSNRPQLGVIAQEVEKQFPQAVDTNPDGYKSVNYPALIAPVIEAVKSLYHRLVGVESQQSEQAREIASLQKLKADRAEMQEQLQAKDQKIQELEQRLKKQEQDTKARLERIEKILNSKGP